MSKTIPVGGHVEVKYDYFGDPDGDWVVAEVDDLLASQFTVTDVKGKVHFFLYTEKGVQWRQVNEID